MVRFATLLAEPCTVAMTEFATKDCHWQQTGQWALSLSNETAMAFKRSQCFGAAHTQQHDAAITEDHVKKQELEKSRGWKKLIA